ncbi:MAG: radical SAM protein [Armatimonadetes bacterium]|nr:radical SAM protein [Armatimonadota bacterium]
MLSEPKINIKPDSMAITIRPDRIYAFDRTGRFVIGFKEGHNFRRSLDNRFMEKWGGFFDGMKERERRFLTEEEARGFYETLRQELVALSGALARGEVELIGKGDRLASESRAWLDRALAADWDALSADRDRFYRVYAPVGILPPDQYLSLVVQATLGCSYNKCTFCDFYRGQRFAIKKPAEFRQHLAAIREFFGEAVYLRKNIFLADANALVIPQNQLIPLMRELHEAFAFMPYGLQAEERIRWRDSHPDGMEGVYAFLDAFSGRKKTVEDFAALRDLHLKRAYIGLETGDDALLAFLNKPGTAGDACEAVAALKAAGVPVGVIVMTGVGGDRFSEGHIRETAQTLRQMALGDGDILYFSEFVEHSGGEYAERAAEYGVRPLSRPEIAAQQQEMVSRLNLPRYGAKVAKYDIREFVY